MYDLHVLHPCKSLSSIHCITLVYMMPTLSYKSSIPCAYYICLYYSYTLNSYNALTDLSSPVSPVSHFKVYPLFACVMSL